MQIHNFCSDLNKLFITFVLWSMYSLNVPLYSSIFRHPGIRLIGHSVHERVHVLVDY